MASTMNPAFLHIRMRNNQMRLLNILALVILVGIAGCESREEARRKQAVNNLKQLGLALHAYHARNPEPANNRESAPSDETSITAPENEAKAVIVDGPHLSVPE